MESHVTVIWCNEPMTDLVPKSVIVVGAEEVVLQYDRLGIDNAKEIRRLAYNTPSESSIQQLIIRTSFATIEAQNALLKLFEEPPVTTKFILLVPITAQLLPTLLSRVQQVKNTVETTQTNAFAEFRALSIVDRLQMIDKEHKKKDSTWLYDMQQSYVRWLQAGQPVTPSLQLVAERLNTRGASNKMLLELLALELDAS